jgi:phage tail sheath protein FI
MSGLITSLDEFDAKYVDKTRPSTEFTLALRGFFVNGGTRCYIANFANASEGIEALGKRDDIQIIAAPGNTAVHEELATQAENLGDRFAILDPDKDADPDDLEPPAMDSKLRRYAAFYFPRIKVKGPLPSDPKDPKDPKYLTEIGPSGHIAGVYARTDASRGVHKAPANEGLRGVAELSYLATDAEQEVWNPKGINLIRLFGSPLVWGARTLAEPSDDYLYISTRRLVTYIEQSIKTSLRFAVFEPNNLALQKTITRSVRGFLDGVWRDGALFGATADEAYYVRFPPNFNNDDARRQGKLVVEIGLRVSYPAEFITFQIGLLSQAANAA